MWSQVEAVSEQGAGLVAVAQTQLAVFWLGQQSPHCPECVQTCLRQKTPDRARGGEERRQRTQVKVVEVCVCASSAWHEQTSATHSSVAADVLRACLTYSAFCRLRGKCSTVG